MKLHSHLIFPIIYFWRLLGHRDMAVDWMKFIWLLASWDLGAGTAPALLVLGRLISGAPVAGQGCLLPYRSNSAHCGIHVWEHVLDASMARFQFCKVPVKRSVCLVGWQRMVKRHAFSLGESKQRLISEHSIDMGFLSLGMIHIRR